MSGYYGGGGDGALVIDSNHVFDSTATRDAYFSANPGELEDGIVIQVGAIFQRRVGSDWVDVTAIVRGPAGSAGAAGAAGADGTDGDNGWTPIFATASDGERRVLRVIDWTGGEGTKPTTGQYVGASGLVASIGDGVDIRGAQGAEGAAGTDPNNLGHYATALELATAHPTGDAGQFAVVGETDTVWVWSVSGSEWINTGASGAVVSLQGLTGALTCSGVGIGVTADGTVITLTNSDTGSAAVGTHEGTYSHADIATNTAARHSHTNKSTLDAIPNHATASEGQAVIRQGDGTLAWGEVSGGSTGFKGHYTSPEQLTAAIPTGQAGWYAIVGSTDTVWVWDTDGEAWIDTDTKGEVSSVNAQTGDVVMTAGTGISVGLDGTDIEVTNTDTGSSAVTTHESTYTHADIASNTSARHTHTNKATLDAIPDHTAAAVGHVQTRTAEGIAWQAPAAVPTAVKTVSFQMFVPGAVADTAGADAFHAANGTTYVYSGPTINLTGLHARLGTLNLTGTQPSISQIKIGGVNLLTGAQEIDSAAGVNKDISAAIGASNTLTDGDRIEIATTPGSLETAAAVLAVAFIGVIA